ncbi:hypothetical protein QBZ16_001132 [Prototheca wickerhamii]|uniref:Phospholipase A-2-activating protein n=1 Tax=Prototheca wickerhamii TaxID=3111 RepID=A0AAD9MJ98_PROWI|nr:hypothetical protein QBZ16_001132 [Prototheca wickerhamii]
MEEFSPYSLRAELRGHAEDVRAVCVCELGVLTGSRDCTIKLWAEDQDGSFSERRTLVGHTDFVTALAYGPPGSLAEEALIVSGSRDASVRIWSVDSAQEVGPPLLGHKYQVTAVAVLPASSSARATQPLVVSASLDATLRVWDTTGACLRVLTGHTGPVLACLAVGETVWSGSGDGTIRVWDPDSGECLRILQAHGDSVRGLTLTSDGQTVISASHDTTLRCWEAASGAATGTVLAGHSSLVYAAAAVEALAASGSEDRTVRLWRLPGGAPLQTLPHPGCVWDVAFLASGDLVTACSDGVARVFTAAPERAAPADVQAAFAASLQAEESQENAAGGSSSGGAGLKMEDPSVLQRPGSKPGQTVVVSEGGTGVAYAWDVGRATWDRIGEVVGAPTGGGESTLSTSGSKVVYGRAWDYVFDVDVEDGAPPRRLPVDAGENPYIAAARFLENEDLPMTYREQIVQFILQNTFGGVAPAGRDSATSGDPLTGQHAYVPPPATAAPTPPVPADAAPEAAPQLFVFDAAPPAEALTRKLLELAPATAAEAAADIVGLAPGSFPRAQTLGTLQAMLGWPAQAMFPALDLARVPTEESAAGLRALLGDPDQLGLDAAAEMEEAAAVLESASASAPAPKDLAGALPAALHPLAPPAARLTAARLVANAYAGPATRDWARVAGAPLVARLAGAAGAGATKALRHALATALSNAAAGLGPGAVAVGAEILSAATDLLLGTPEDEEEARARCLLALAAVVRGVRGLRAGAAELGLADVAGAIAGGAGGDSARSAATALQSALR